MCVGVGVISAVGVVGVGDQRGGGGMRGRRSSSGWRWARSSRPPPAQKGKGAATVSLGVCP